MHKCDLIARQICSNRFVRVGSSVDINKNMSNSIMAFPKGSIRIQNMVCTLMKLKIIYALPTQVIYVCMYFVNNN